MAVGKIVVARVGGGRVGVIIVAVGKVEVVVDAQSIVRVASRSVVIIAGVGVGKFGVFRVGGG